VPVEARENQKQEVGVMAIDAIYTPVKSVHFDVSNVRVGQRTDFDKLEIVMETDGGLTGQEAMDIAAHILVDHFTMLFSADFAKIEGPAETAQVIGDEPTVQEPEGENEIQASSLSTRAKNALVKNGITTLADLQAQTTDQISNLSGLGDKTIKEILEFLGR
jgi:DNA-directed RNA polymerase subunit alpha